MSYYEGALEEDTRDLVAASRSGALDPVRFRARAESFIAVTLALLAPTTVRADSAPPPSDPVFTSSVSPIPEAVAQEMRGVSWEEGCPVPLEGLRLVRVSHWGFDDAVHQGELVIAAQEADGIVEVFRTLFAAHFFIERMERIDAYDGEDDRSMKANNTSALNCRKIKGSKRMSEHSFGTALDLNPLRNPFVRGKYVSPEEGRPYAHRKKVRRGMITADGPVVAAFAAIGWKWGGNWKRTKDYQHFSKSGQ